MGRKGIHYIESLIEGEKERYGTLQGLFDTLATKFRPQYNQTIKSLQFRQLHGGKGKGVDKGTGRLHMWWQQNVATKKLIGNLKNNSFMVYT